MNCARTRTGNLQAKVDDPDPTAEQSPGSKEQI